MQCAPARGNITGEFVAGAVQQPRQTAAVASEDFVKTRIQSLSSLAILAIAVGMISWGSALHAQTTPSQTPDRQAQQPSSSPDTTPSQQTPQTSPTPSPNMPDTQTPSDSQTPSSSTPPSQTPDTTQQTPDTNPSGGRTPDAGAQTPSNNGTGNNTAGSSTGNSSTGSSADTGAASNGGAQTFTGTVTKQGDKYVLKDDAGHTYDIDHQDEVKKFEGKRVRVQGTLDSSSNKIMVK